MAAVEKPLSPLEDLIQYKEAATNQKRVDEHKLWETWKDGGQKPTHLEPLLGAFKPVINAKIREWKAPRVVESAFRGELQKQMIKAFETFDPNRGATLRTHVENRLQKAKRFNTQIQNFAYIPEDSVRFIGKINKAQDELREDYGRDPTHAEIAERVSGGNSRDRINAKRVGEIISYQRKDLPGSGWTYDPAPRVSNRDQEVLSLVNAERELIFPNPDERAVFEHIYGYNGKEQISATNDLAKKLGKSPSQISRLKSAVGNRIKAYR